MVTSGSAKNRAVILSDNDKLALVIELALKNYPGLEIIRVVPGGPGQSEGPVQVGGCQLIIVAAISPTSEPIAMLARASLVEQIGQIPMLIISDRPFLIDPGTRIAHLDFPFREDELPSKIQALLEWRALSHDRESVAYPEMVAQ